MNPFDDWPDDCRVSSMDPNRTFDLVQTDDGAYKVTYSDSTRTVPIRIQTMEEVAKEAK